MPLSKRTLGALTGAMIAGVVGLAAGGQLAPTEEALILELRLRDMVLSDGMPAHVRGEAVFLPLGELSQALELAIRVEPATGRARGWFLKESRSFDLDTRGRTVRISGHTKTLGDNDTLEANGELFIRAPLLAQWFPLTIDVSLANLQVIVRGREPLPVEVRLDREAKRRRIASARRSTERPVYPRRDAPYGWIGWPSLDVATQGFVSSREGAAGMGGRYDLTATTDLLKLGGELFLSGTDRTPLKSASLRLGRVDPEGGLLGPLDATEVAIGDVFPPDVGPFTARSQRALGLLISNFPLDRPAEFDRTTLTGEAPAGWEIELSRNGALLDFQIVAPNGLFTFRDVPLLYGLNLFTFTRYGPHGEERRETRQIYVGPGLSAPGQSHYRLGITRQGANALPVERDEQLPGDGEVRVAGEWEIGLARGLSAALSVTSVPLPADQGRRHTYGGLGLVASLGGVLTSLDLATDGGRGTAVQLGGQTEWRGLQFFAQHARFQNFESEKISDHDSLTSRTRLRLEWPALLDLPLGQTLEWGEEKHRSGATTKAAQHRLSTRFGPVLASHQLRWSTAEGPSSERQQTTTGAVLFSALLRRFSTHADVQYSANRGLGLNTASLSAEGNLGGWGSVSVGATQNLAGTKTTTLALGWRRKLGGVQVGLHGEYGTNGAVSLNLSLDFGLGRDSETGSWCVGSRVGASRGLASARVLLDRNANGVADPDDTPVPHVGFLVNGGQLPAARTDNLGRALLPDLPAHRFAQISLDEGTLEDPYWTARTPGYLVLSRPGAQPHLDFLVQETGAIEGTVYGKREGEIRRTSGLRLQLVDRDERIVQETLTAFDGFYVFERVPLGSYRLRVSAESASGRRIEVSSPRSVLLTSDRPVRTGLDWILDELAEMR